MCISWCCRQCSFDHLISLLNLSVLKFSFVFHDKAKRTQQGNMPSFDWPLFEIEGLFHHFQKWHYLLRTNIPPIIRKRAQETTFGHCKVVLLWGILRKGYFYQNLPWILWWNFSSLNCTCYQGYSAKNTTLNEGTRKVLLSKFFPLRGYPPLNGKWSKKGLKLALLDQKYLFFGGFFP